MIPIIYAFCCGYQAAQVQAQASAPTVDSARAARHLGISEGVRKPRRRLTRAEKIRATDVAFGLIGGGR